MKSFFVVALLLAAGASAFSQQKLPPTINGKQYRIVTNKLDAATIAARREKFLRKTGGMIRRETKERAIVVDLQGKVPPEVITPVVAALAKDTRSKMEYVSAKDATFSISEAKNLLAKCKAVAAIFLVDDATLPLSLVAMEAGWSVVNVNPLSQDKPSEDVLKDRTQKMLVRTATVFFGGAESDMKFSAMQPVSSVRDLDSMPGHGVVPASMIQMIKHMQKIGVAESRPVPYAQACQEGWAPAPTNEYQKAVWERAKDPTYRWREDFEKTKKESKR